MRGTTFSRHDESNFLPSSPFRLSVSFAKEGRKEGRERTKGTEGRRRWKKEGREGKRREEKKKGTKKSLPSSPSEAFRFVR